MRNENNSVGEHPTSARVRGVEANKNSTAKQAYFSLDGVENVCGGMGAKLY